METALIEAHVARRMRDLGFKSYFTRLTPLVIAPSEVREIGAYNELYFLLEDNSLVKIESDFGIYDMTGILINELSYEHHGQIRIENTDTENQTILKFIQAIAKHED